MRTLRIAAALAALLWAGAVRAEPFPNWDINRGALEDTLDLLKSVQLEPDTLPHKAILRAGREALFNRYVVWHTRARDYLAAHWSGYSEFDQLNCALLAKETAARGAATPSYIQLLMCVPGGVSPAFDKNGSPIPGGGKFANGDFPD